MDGFLALLGLLGVVLFAVWISRRGGPSEQQRPRPVSRHTHRPPAARQQRNTSGTRFDADHARHLAKPRVLTGRAYITDGDTITLKKTQIRLFGIDAPELDHPYGKKAKWALQKMCKGHVVRAEVTDIDDYGRTVARCTLPDGRDLSAEMVRQGLAIDWPKFSGGAYTHMEPANVRKKLFLADARQKGRMHVWRKYEAQQAQR